MKYLYSFNSFIERHITFVAPTCVLLGVLTSRWFSSYQWLAAYFFTVMAFQGSLSSDFSALKDVGRHPLPVFVVIGFLHLLMPVLGYLLGMIFFHNDMHLVTGIVIEQIVPAGMMGMTWAELYGGNMALSLSIMVLDTLVSPFLLPAVLSVILGTAVRIPAWPMMRSMILMIVIPSLLALTLNQVTHGKAKETLRPKLTPFARIAMICVMTLNSTKVAPYLLHLKPLYILVLLFMLFIIVFAYFVMFGITILMREKVKNATTMIFSGGIRNISVGAVLAARYFPGGAIFPVLVGTLFQQMLAGILGHWFGTVLRERGRKEARKERQLQEHTAESHKQDPDRADE